MAILIKGSYEQCDSCNKIKEVNVIYAGINSNEVNQMILCDDCSQTLKNIIQSYE